MIRLLWLPLAVALAGTGASQAEVQSEASHVAQPATPDATVDATDLLPKLAPMPSGKATLIGGRISTLDRVRDQLTLRPFGAKPLHVLFDERTTVYRDGKKASTRDLHPGDKIYIDTVWDRTDVIAKTIRVVSESSAGQSRGQIVSYDPNKRILVLNDALSPETIMVEVPSGTKITHEDKEVSLSSLHAGSLISLEFSPAGNGHILANQISILAEPGAAFTFVGRVTYLDLRKGILALVDPRDKKQYEISFDPNATQINGDLQQGADITVNAGFNGTGYVTSAILVNTPASK